MLPNAECYVLQTCRDMRFRLCEAGSSGHEVEESMDVFGLVFKSNHALKRM